MQSAETISQYSCTTTVVHQGIKLQKYRLYIFKYKLTISQQVSYIQPNTGENTEIKRYLHWRIDRPELVYNALTCKRLFTASLMDFKPAYIQIF